MPSHLALVVLPQPEVVFTSSSIVVLVSLYKNKKSRGFFS